MKADILRFMEKYQMTAPGDTVICALSGGKDSMALLHVLLELREPLGIRVTAAHFNHQLRGWEAQRDQDFAEAQCRRLGVPLEIGTRDVAAYAQSHHLGTEEAARLLRYEFLEGLEPGAKIATAHNAQDNLETMLMRLLRGCGLHGLSAIPPVRGRIIRPLLLTAPETISAYLEANSIPHIEDSSNASDDYLRNRLRHQVIPLLRREAPNLSASASALCLRLGEDDHYLDESAKELLASMTSPKGLSCTTLRALPEAMALRVLRQYLREVPELSGTHLEAAMALLRGSEPSARISLPGGFLLGREYDALRLFKEAPEPAEIPEITLYPGETKAFGPYQVSCTAAPAPAHLEPGSIALAADNVRLPLTLRPRLPGDRIRLPGGTKKLSRLMIDKKIPAAQRDMLPVALQENQVLALIPCAVSAEHRAWPGTASFILTVKRTEEEK